MDLSFTEEQQELREAARAFLRDHGGSAQVRAAMATPAGHDPEVWKRIGTELGWPALPVAEAHGGLGLGMVELVALQEVIGEFLLPSPFFATACLAVPLIQEAATPRQQAALLPGIAEGSTRATLAFPGPCGYFDARGVEVLAHPARGGVELEGELPLVLDGHTADLLLVPAREPGSRGAQGVGIYVVRAGTRGLERTPLPTMDQTRRGARVRLDRVAVGAGERLGAGASEGPAGFPALSRALDRAAIALAAEQIGGAQRALDLAVAHARERVQFGRPIGSFQAIKHKCADRMVEIESARSAVYHAACVAAEGVDGTEGLRLAASLAKARASEAFFRAAADCLQIHGGVGFTWEYDVHLLLKRARATEGFLGSPAFHRERVARHLLGPAPAAEGVL